MARPKSATCAVCGRKAHPDGIRHLWTTKGGTRKPGRYQARFVGPDGRSYSQTFLTVADAKVWLSQQHADISNGKFARQQTKASTVRQFGPYAERWMATRKVKGQPLADRTRDGYRDLLDRFILDAFKTRPLHLIDREEVEDWYDGLPADRPTYRAKAYGLLRTILATAVDEGHLRENPARIRGASAVERVHEIRPATREELAVLVDAMPPRYRLMVQLATWCGPRFGELTELRRSDLDTKTGKLRITRAVVHVNGQAIVKKPKTRAGVRTVHIPAALMPMVRDHLLQHTAPGPDGLLFPAKNEPTEHLRQSSLIRVYYPAREKAGRPDLRFHDLRHTGAVIALQSGATIPELMARYGWSTPAAAMRYLHAAEGRDAVIADRLSAVIEGSAT